MWIHSLKSVKINCVIFICWFLLNSKAKESLLLLIMKENVKMIGVKKSENLDCLIITKHSDVLEQIINQMKESQFCPVHLDDCNCESTCFWSHAASYNKSDSSAGCFTSQCLLPNRFFLDVTSAVSLKLLIGVKKGIRHRNPHR